MSDTPISGFEPCAHSTPQASSCLHGICVFCYRDRLGTALNERNAANEAIVDCHREYDILWDELIQLREERDRLVEQLATTTTAWSFLAGHAPTEASIAADVEGMVGRGPGRDVPFDNEDDGGVR